MSGVHHEMRVGRRRGIPLAIVLSLSASLWSEGRAGAQTLLETITVISTRDGAAGFNPPSFESQQERFLRRPGAETVVSVRQQDPGRLANMGDALATTPGVFFTERGAGSSGFISMRGSDIASDGGRNGRGIRAYLDGFPIGRTEAGLTNQLIDMLATDYLEVYRGGSSLRYGAIATGGALNFVSKTGRSAPGTGVSVSGGSFGNRQAQVEHGGFKEAFDWYVQGNYFNNDGFQQHTREQNYRLSGNVGWRPNLDVESRTFFAAGRTNADLAEPIPLNQLAQQRRIAPPNSYLFNEDLNFQYQRVANRTTIRAGDNTTYELGGFFLNTHLDHLPSPFAGIVDYGWREGGGSGRVEHKTTIGGLPAELVGGLRVGYTAGDFDRFQHRNAGTEKGRQIYDWTFASWLVESYAESAIEILPRVRVFNGVQGVYTTRTLDDEYRGGAVAALGPTMPGGPQPGRIAGSLEYNRDFSAVNPKVGINWEHTLNHFLFANVTRSYEVPSGADLSNVLETQGRTGRKLPPVEAQSAWTYEAGVRGGWDRFKYDITLYHMKLRNEILTRCGTEVSPTCTTTIAFNADRTIHNGTEVGFKTLPFVDIIKPGDNIFANITWNYTDFRFDSDPVFGNERMPVIPAHQLFGELGYRHPSGFYASVNLRHLTSRRATFDGTGGDAFVIPAYSLLGAKAGWRAPGGAWSVFVEGRNLTDEIYVSEFSATPTVPVTQQGPVAVRSVTPTVRPGDGRAVYAGMSARF